MGFHHSSKEDVISDCVLIDGLLTIAFTYKYIHCSPKLTQRKDNYCKYLVKWYKYLYYRYFTIIIEELFFYLCYFDNYSHPKIYLVWTKIWLKICNFFIKVFFVYYKVTQAFLYHKGVYQKFCCRAHWRARNQIKDKKKAIQEL